ncbi:hypothetical protein ALP90_200114 [Pseudomonas amygdali pv. ulmi]|uniref:CobQ/CobB/MinD/ParA nucleotide binding domain-containing protein n=1 Tax=Pseudomonas amygdali pv. ulmi TaxID=251720 RepID=A0A3M4S8F0_PSEA0|nr:AAA family ATPase [Pseudomonas amygdali]RMR11233.1 hypothetical protein ALP90_200114 [Pseudomonas amygdali pv. ulmi]
MIILFGSHKGGVGKTTLIANLAVMLQKKTASVAIVRADKNQDLEVWAGLRAEKDVPDIPVMTCYGDISKDIRKLETVTDVVFVDTAGHDSMELRSALTVADIFLTPVKPSSLLEIATLDGLSSIFREAQKKNSSLQGFTLFNRCPTSSFNNDAQDLAEYLRTNPEMLPPLRSCVSDLRPYEKAVNQGLGVHEVRAKNASRAKGQLELLFTEIQTKID